ncbi:MAG: adenylate kinase [Armatimonadetes bacterium]|nr:adenylate kinase [Armatimonadota bacterium]
MNLIFLGPNGAGKGTQARLLHQREGIPQIATGDMLRAASAAGTPLGREAERYVRAGELVPDAVMIGLVADRLQQEDTSAGFVLDGFPRTIAQAEALEAVLAGMNRHLDRVIYFEVSETTLIKRLSGRMLCRAQGHIYNVHSNLPKTPGVCDVDGSPLYTREDDRPETVRRRLQVYREQTEPLLAFYRARGLYAMLNAEGDVEAIYRVLLALIAPPVCR